MLGILLSDPSSEQIQKISSLNSTDIDYCIFSYKALPEGNAKSVPHLQPLRAYSFEGTLIATDIRTAEFANTLSTPADKLFYITSMEWTEATNLHYNTLENIYLNNNMDLLTSNEKDYKLISHLFKKPRGIVTDWNFSELFNEH